MTDKTRPLLIAPSILASDFSELGREVRDVVSAGADWIHLDPMDGHFVPNLTFGPPIIEKMRRHTDAVFDAHLMISPADPYLEAFAKAGCDVITVHAEAGPHLHRSLQTIRGLGKKAGVAINPATPVSSIADMVDHIDLVLVMSINPGFGGQTFLPLAVEKVRQVRALLNGRDVFVEVDGGITPETAPLVVEAGADVLVAGSAIFKGTPETYADNIAAIRNACA